MAYGSIDDQASPTNIKPQPASRGNSDRAMGDIDAAASPSAENSPEDPGKPIPKLDDANYGGINSITEISMAEQCPGSTVTLTNNSFNDDVAQYRKGEPDNNAELLRVRNQAWNSVGETQDNTKPPFIGRQDSDPLGG